MCKHVDIRDFYTVRHHATVRVLRKAIGDGRHANSLTLVSFGRDGEVVEDVTVPDWMLPREAKQKRAKYGELVKALKARGWKVEDEVSVTTVGVHGTVPLANEGALERLGVTGKSIQREVQVRMAREAIRHLNRVVRQYRILTRRARKGGRPAEARAGVG